MTETVAGLRVERDGGLAIVVIDRPAQRNALRLAMWQGLATIFRGFDADPDVRGVILTGAGKVFSAGADIPEFDQTRASVEQSLAYEAAVDAACDAIAATGRPVIAAMEGFCYGGACHLAMACDFRFAAPDLKCAIPAAKLSIVYSVRGMARLKALVGLTEAKRIFYSAEAFDAAGGLATGFLVEVTDDPLATAKAYLHKLEAGAPLSIAGSKLILNGLAMTDAPFDAKAAADAMLRAMGSEDYAEGRLAFAEKRPPNFRGH